MTIRRALLIGFGAVLSLWLLSASELVRRLHGLEAEAAAIHARFARSEDLLVRVRGEILNGSVYLRDVALDLDPDAVRMTREQLLQTRRTVDDTLARYLDQMDSDAEREAWTRLHTEIEEYWRALSPLLTRRSQAPSAQARALLRDRALSRQEAVISISDAIRRLNREAYRERREDLALLHSTLRRNVWGTIGILVALGGLIASAATRYAGRLECRIRDQHRQELAHKLQLQELSARLVTAQEEERRTLARDLHDEVGQALTAVKIELAAVERELVWVGDGPRERLGEARAVTDGVLQTIRDLSRLLHPGMLDDFGLVETLRWYVRGFARRTGLHARVEGDHAMDRLPPDLEVCVYRVVQEALTNVARHAGATACAVFLEHAPEAFTVSVEDDGAGMPGRGGHEKGLGLLGMRERVAGFGGTLRIERGAGNRGTRVVASFPLTAHGPADSRETDMAPGTPGADESERRATHGEVAHPAR